MYIWAEMSMITKEQYEFAVNRIEELLPLVTHQLMIAMQWN